MTDNTRDNKSFEQLLLNAVQAEQAGVFDSTPVDAAELLESGSARKSGRNRGWLHVARVVTPLAACLGLWVGFNQTGLWAPVVPVPSVESVGNSLVNGEAICYDFTMFERCFTGPGSGSASGDCACADLDNDGDVDFADFGRFQRLISPQDG